MIGYYSAIVWMSIFAVVVIQISVGVSSTLTKDKKKVFNLLFSAIAISALCEWLGVMLQGSGGKTRIIHIIIKALELSIAPSIGFLISWVIELRRVKVPLVFLGVNAVLEILSGVFGFIYTVDSNSTYTHAKFYPIYIVAYLISIVYFIYVASRNMKRYQYNGIAFFAMMVVFMLTGITVQLINSEIRIVYVVLSIASIMMYVFTLEMVMQTDNLTELINRRGYENYISHLDKECIILFFDIDNFKNANDKYGHTYGDSCLKKTGNALKTAYAKYGKCFRYGGDEFCVIITRNMQNVEKANEVFKATMEKMRSYDRKLPDVSVGFSHFYPENDSILTSIEEADKMMYDNKSKHKAL